MQGDLFCLHFKSFIFVDCYASPEVDEDEREAKQAEIDSLKSRVEELEEELELERMK